MSLFFVAAQIKQKLTAAAPMVDRQDHDQSKRKPCFHRLNSTLEKLDRGNCY